MNLFKVCGTGLLAAMAAGCWSHDTGGVAVTPDAVAGLRYINLVSDTSALNFRVVDVINNAPNSINAVFRTGGNPYGVTTAFLPPYMPVDAGTRHIKVFMYSTIDTVATKVVLDTTFTFVVNTNYTFYLTGYARASGTPQVRALITTDAVPTIAAGKIAIRVINLAPDLSGNYAGASPSVALDSRIDSTTSAVPLAGAAVSTNTAFLGMGSYTAVDTSNPTTPYRLAVTANGTTSPILFQAVMPQGTRGTSSSNPIGGTRVVGTALSAIIVPRSVPGSGAPQTTPTAVTANIDSLTRSNDTVTVWRAIGAPTATACGVPVAAGVAANDLLNVTGLTQPEYNGSVAVISVTAGVQAANFPTCTPVNPSRFRYRLTGTPVSPATGTPSFRIVTAGNDYTAPWILFALDNRPPQTAP